MRFGNPYVVWPYASYALASQTAFEMHHQDQLCMAKGHPEHNGLGTALEWQVMRLY